MITLLLLIIMSLIIFVIGIGVLSIGGSVFLIIFADLIVALGIIWFIFFRRHKR